MTDKVIQSESFKHIIKAIFKSSSCLNTWQNIRMHTNGLEGCKSDDGGSRLVNLATMHEIC